MSNPHVLVVDDEADIRALIQDILVDEGYCVEVACCERRRSSRCEKQTEVRPGASGYLDA